ncbi:MAG: Na+/H+ antiporter subunit D [Halorhodospira halophila]|uniref:Na+/H+ antiporter subunit D n=1 Tax=Halorhodospira TaxID=85108 RepID=UPI001914CD17|nr:Na+/H+ antiporter subunit D [Halorhodospira halophila]MCG5533507.1 Na+/H+ antiporter subunit D [Halorhodospira sp. 9621]MCG5544363.1 Na+/H+ antiporter subunit D [Halorhodospira sp. 9628]MBK5935347.1 Na+/H+ antiporter subunit D [Halorhodospira halophila]MBK5944343.1 Na+/H+ antiporter subunit D [Halorhodospira halophila]MCC3751395.1 Na+/H+ antiporter subunit D [Halorhodospira halophila]
MSLQVAIPVLLPLLLGAVSLAVHRHLTVQRWLGVLGTGALLASTLWLLHTVWHEGVVVMHMGDWKAPFGITLVADLLGAIMAVLTGIMGFATAVYSTATTPRGHEHYGHWPLLHLLLAGVAGAFLTGDVFNLYVWFEVMLVASFALLILGGERAQMEGAIKYVTLNLLSSMIFLSAVGITYGLVGTLNMADMAVKLAEVDQPGLVTVLAAMYMVSFGIKAGAFPLFFWLPASYHTPPIAISALFAGLLTKVGVYALYRVFTLIFTQEVAYTHEILLWAAGFTMITGVLGAAYHYEVRRILSFHIISQIGYMIMGLALFTPLALIGGVFYIAHHIIVKTNLFLVAGVAYRMLGSYELRDLGGLYKHRPFLGLLFAVPALSLAGLPPLSGFIAKLIVIWAGVEQASWGIVFVALLTGLLTLYSMTKIWQEAFWHGVPEHVQDTSVLTGERRDPGLWAMYLPIAGLALLTLFIGLYAQPLYELAEASAKQLLDPQVYIDAVLEEGAQ